ncbi:MAG: hypothetical protein GXO87_03750 [Chlorobi bacterium]|nr:hypothetical protein [Chlorobiota bacterium]
MKFIKLMIFPLLLLVLFAGCATTKPVNDFFGIEMFPKDMDNFKIKAYTVESGISYASSPFMNPNLFAWAEVETRFLRLKLVNNTSNPIPLVYDMDSYTLFLKNGKHVEMQKGNRYTYNRFNPLGPGSSVEFLLEFPEDYWSRIGKNDPQPDNPNYLEDFWKGENSLNFAKEQIEHIEVNLGGMTYILLKRVPELPEERESGK